MFVCLKLFPSFSREIRDVKNFTDQNFLNADVGPKALFFASSSHSVNLLYLWNVEGMLLPSACFSFMFFQSSNENVGGVNSMVCIVSFQSPSNVPRHQRSTDKDSGRLKMHLQLHT